ncbi:MAG: S26 family signal peptidase, partial [Pseudomonadota bacterium]
MSGRATKLALWTILPVGGCLAAALFGPPLAARLMGGGYYAVPSGSMLPGLLPGDRVVGWAPDGMPARGSVVAFRRPDGAEQIAR